AKTVTPGAMERLIAYRWPGNVRELENLIQRLTALYSQEEIDLDTIEAELASSAPAGSAASESKGDSLSSTIERHQRAYFSAHRDGLPAPALYGPVLRELVRSLIASSL